MYINYSKILFFFAFFFLFLFSFSLIKALRLEEEDVAETEREGLKKNTAMFH